eukprot:m.15211 g.15211  ORF g.15211 m.15211 type:complete len:226 (+) comp10486_c0_seq1:148-825(+)
MGREALGSAMVISGELAIMLSAMTVFAAVGFVVYNRNLSARQHTVRCVRENKEEEEEEDEDDPDRNTERDGVALASVIQPLFDLPNDDALLNLGKVFSYSSISPDLSPTSRRRRSHASSLHHTTEPAYDTLVSNNDSNSDRSTCDPTHVNVEDHDQDIRIFKEILEAAVNRDNNAKEDGANAYEMLQSWRPPKVKLQLSKENRDKIAALAIGRRERRTTLTVQTV